MSNAGDILLVDDDPTCLELGAAVLEACDFSVVTASDPLIAISLAMQMKSELTAAILDYHMLFMNGSTLAKCLKAICPNLRVILHSADATLKFNDLESIDAFVEKGNGFMVVVETLLDMKLSNGGFKLGDSRSIRVLNTAASNVS